MEQNLSAAYIRSIVRRRALYFVVPLVLGSLATVAVVRSLPAMYSSKATLLVESQQIPPDLVRSTITALASERLQIIEQRITARDNVLELVRKYNLLRNQSNLSTSDVVEEVRSRISIEQADLRVRGQGEKERVAMVFHVAFEDESPQIAMQVTNELVTSILNEDVKARTALASETSQFLEREANRLAAELDDVETQLSSFRLKNADALPEKLPFNMSSLEKVQKDISDVDRDLLAIEESRRFLAFEQSVRVATSDGKAATGSLADLEQRTAALKAEIATLSASYSDSHPEMRTRRRALKALEDEIRSSNNSRVGSASDAQDQDAEGLTVEERITAEKLRTLETRSSFQRTQKAKLEKQAEFVRSLIEKTPLVAGELNELERRQQGLRKSFDEIGEKLAEARLSERLEQDQQAERFEVIEQPIQPQEPTSPNRPRLLAMGSALSVAVGGALAVGLEMIDGALRTVGGLEGKTGLKPLVVLPYIDTIAARRRRRAKLAMFGLGAALALITAIGAVHFFYRPLDEIYFHSLQLIQKTVW